MEDDNVRLPVMLPLTKREKALFIAYSETHTPSWSTAKAIRVTARAFLLLKYGKANSVDEALELSEQRDKDKK